MEKRQPYNNNCYYPQYPQPFLIWISKYVVRINWHEGEGDYNIVNNLKSGPFPIPGPVRRGSEILIYPIFFPERYQNSAKLL